MPRNRPRKERCRQRGGHPHIHPSFVCEVPPAGGGVGSERGGGGLEGSGEGDKEDGGFLAREGEGDVVLEFVRGVLLRGGGCGVVDLSHIQRNTKIKPEEG